MTWLVPTLYTRRVAPTSQITTSCSPCPMRHCCPVGEATEICGVLEVMATELKQTRDPGGDWPGSADGDGPVTRPRTRRDDRAERSPGPGAGGKVRTREDPDHQ